MSKTKLHTKKERLVKKADNEADFMLEIKISKTSLSQISDLQTTTGLSSGTQRATRAFRTISATATSLRGIVANIADIGDTIKIFENKINNWDNEPIESHYIFILYVLSKLPPKETSVSHSYYVVDEKDGNYRIRISSHNAKPINFLNKSGLYKVGITFKKKSESNSFESNTNIFYKENVYYTENTTSDTLKEILKGIVKVLKGGLYDAPCDKVLFSPSKEKYEDKFGISNNSQENLQGCKASEYFKIPIATDIATLENGIDEILKNYSGRDIAAYQAEKYLKESIDISNEWLKKKSLKRREDFKKWCANRQAKLRKTVLQQRREDMAKLNVDRILEEAKIQNIEYMIKNGQGTFAFAEHIKELYGKGEKMDWLKAKKIAKYFGISSETEIMQSCELAIVLESRRIAQNGNSIRQQYEELKDLYERQVNIKPLDTKSKILQQYSTPCPLAYLLGTFIKGSSSRKERYFEPSAGNGMLTIALPENKTCVNEIDEVRISNLQSQNFANVWNFDSSNIKNLQKEEIGTYKGVITNPPFGKLERKEQITRNGWDINTLDYKMAIYALDTMLDNGRASIIVGGKMWNAYWKQISSSNSDKEVLFGQFKTFLGYLYAQYNVVDVIYIDGEYIYRKQGTQYPIVVILVDGRHEYNESNKPNYVFDKNRDKILTTFDQIFDRIFPYLENNDKEKEKRAKALFFKMKMQSVNFPSLGNNDYDDIFKKYTDFIKEALSSKTHSRIECTELISEHSKRIVNRLLKKNINKYYLTADDIRHSRNVHGKVTEYLKNQIPITELDFIRIPEILYSPTNIDLSNPNTKNGQGIRFVKEYTDGKIFCVMIDEYETEELSVKTNYKKPPLQGIDVLPKAAPKHNVRNARALPMLNANVVNFFRIK